jgi:hypothetical protein
MYQSKKTSTARAAPLRDYTRTVYRRHLGSIPAEQWKKVDLAGNPATRKHPEQEVFLQPANTTPNVGVKSGGREEEREWNEPTPPGGFI